MFEGKVDEKGTAKVKAEISANNYAPGMLTANFVVRAFEESGDFSIDRFSIPYAPYEAFVGIKPPKGENTWGALMTDKEHSVEVKVGRSAERAFAPILSNLHVIDA